MNPKNLFLLFSLFFSFAYLPAQQSVLYFHELNSQGKLSQTTNEFVFCDSRGFVWISSNDGLNRYDGINVEVYKPDGRTNGLEGHNIQSNFYEDDQGLIWFCTYEAINCYRPQSNDFEHHQFQKFNTDYHIFHYEKARHLLWVKIGQSIYTFDVRQKKFSQAIFNNVNGIRFSVIADQTTGAVQSIWSWTFNGRSLVQIYTHTKEPLQRLDGFTGLIYKVVPQSADSFWVLTHTSLMLISKNEAGQFVKKAIEPKGLHTGEVPLSMLLYKKDQLLFWLPDGGLATYLIAHNRIQRRWHLHPFNSPEYPELIGRSMYLDPAQNIWLSIKGLGLRYASLNRKTFEFVTLSETTNKASEKIEITTLCNLGNGRILLTDRRRGLFIYTPHLGMQQPKNAALLENQPIYNVNVDAQGKAYFFSFEHVFVYDPKTNTIAPPLKNEAIVLSTFTLQNKQVLAAAYGLGKLMNWSLDQPQDARPIRGLDDRPPMYDNMFQDKQGNIYLPYNDQHILLGRLHRDSFALKDTLKIRGNISGYVEDSANEKIWIASSYGLYRVNTKNFRCTAVPSRDGSTKQYLHSLLPDPLGRLWMSTNNGLFCFDPKKQSSKRYGIVDGLPAIEFTSRTGIVDVDGQMLWGTRKGLVHFDPLKMGPLDNQPKLVLLDFNANNQSRQTLQNALQEGKIHLPFKSNSISFHFQGIEYSDPQNIQLYYRLEPLEKDWNKLVNGQGKVRYPKLAPGHYTLKLNAITADSAQASQMLSYSINIAKPFHQTFFFYGLIAVLVFLIGYGISKLSSNQKFKKQVEKQELIEAERNRMMEDLHDGIGFDLTAIKAISEKSLLTNTDPTFKEQFEKVFTRAQDAMRTMSEIFRATDEQYETLGAFLEWVEEKVKSFMKDIDMELNITTPEIALDTKIRAEARQNLWLVIKETLHNIAKHARATHTHLHFWVEKDVLNIEIQDNGKGFNPENLRKGKGMRNMPKRMKNIEGSFEVIPQKQGTLVALSVPLHPLLKNGQTVGQQLKQLFT